jgi:hypothetical protein
MYKKGYLINIKRRLHNLEIEKNKIDIVRVASDCKHIFTSTLFFPSIQKCWYMSSTLIELDFCNINHRSNFDNAVS